jgi:two-component system, LuxR family, sensor kinase FixL
MQWNAEHGPPGRGAAAVAALHIWQGERVGEMNPATGKTVLILEDDPGVARLQRLRLERAGLAVTVTVTPSEALERIRQGGIDLLVLDNRLSVAEDGLTFYTRLKGLGFDLPVILVTGYSDDATIVRALRSGVRDYVFKSVEYLEYLPEAVRRVLDQERTKQQLAGSEALLQAVLNSALDPIITMDEQSRVTLMNPAAEKVFGCLGSTVVGSTINRLLPAVVPGIAPWANDLLPAPTELAGRRGDGTALPLEVTCSRVDIPNQVLYILILRDVTERKRAEGELRATADQRAKALAELQSKTDELRVTTQQLWQAARLAGVGELAASIAHELNNPLGTVSLRIEGVLAKVPQGDPNRRPLEIVEQEVERMGKLVGNLLHFSRAGREQVSTVNVLDEVRKTIELTEPHLRRLRVEVIPEFQAVPDIFADRQQLRQVLLNLFTNAGDAMPEGGRLIPRVRLGELPTSRPAVVIEVADTGSGIAAEHLPKVMEPFFTTKEDGKGTGLGLAICRRIVHEHQGKLEIESVVGQGTTVRITLPVQGAANVNGLHRDFRS